MYHVVAEMPVFNSVPFNTYSVLGTFLEAGGWDGEQKIEIILTSMEEIAWWKWQEIIDKFINTH